LSKRRSGDNGPCPSPNGVQVDVSQSLAEKEAAANLAGRRATRLLKIERLAARRPPRVLDLFSGCGGLSLGFKTAGFELAGAVEIDELAAASYAANFHAQTAESRLRFAQAHDITAIEPEDLVAAIAPDVDPASAIDVVVGGPPCQAYARVGRAKLREVAAHPEAFRQDDRANLYLRYLHYVRVLQPLVLLVENVPDVMNFAGHNIPQEICEVLSDMGYVCAYTLLNAAYYGVPQMRERMFLVAFAAELECGVRFPVPSHWIELPKGYEGSRQVAMKAVKADLFSLQRPDFFVQPPRPTPDLPVAVSARAAISDLPVITDHLHGTVTRGARRFNVVAPYPTGLLLSPYETRMRDWPAFGNHVGVRDHVVRTLPRDYAIFAAMQPGDQYPQAHLVALRLFEERLSELAAKGENVELGSEAYSELKRQMVPPYDPGKFPNKWRKMEADLPARTLLAHLGKDGYSHIHYDSAQARTISVREAARLQSFPDGFVFCGTMNPAFRQIGNAVPPLLALALAKSIIASIRGG
jgi:DNA (cytosine-5)-methyltransferase 1